MKIEKFNDFLAFSFLIIASGLFAANRWIELPRELVGLLITLLALVFNFYFRKNKPEKK